VLRINPSTQEAVDIIKNELPTAMRVDWWREPSYPGNYIDAMVGGSDIETAKNMLAAAGLDFEVFIEDVQKQIDSTHTLNSREHFTAVNGVAFDYSKYHTLDEISDWMKTLPDSYPDLVELVDVGTSFEGRTITAVKFTGKSNSFARLGRNSTDAGAASSKPGLW
jgi:carboxypeptidase A2